MTGFARISTQTESANIVWEARSVNHKSIDIKLRTTLALDEIDNIIKKQVNAHFVRGSIGLNLNIVFLSKTHTPKINEAYLKELLLLSKSLEKEYGLEKPSLSQLLALEGVMEKNHDIKQTLDDESLKHAVLASFEELMLALKVMRQEEGKTLQKLLLLQLDKMQDLTNQARNDPSRSKEAIFENLEKSISVLFKTNTPLDTQRLHMEAALLAVRADILEEIDRLDGHIEAAKKLVLSQEAVGRRLDFLAQEFNREANTLCSKANSPSLSKIGLALKAVIDQWREQIQNIE